MTDTKTAEHYTALAAQVKAERADMLLRAAAPDSLDALENLLAVNEGQGGTRYHAQDIARAAIAKAKGNG